MRNIIPIAVGVLFLASCAHAEPFITGVAGLAGAVIAAALVDMRHRTVARCNAPVLKAAGELARAYMDKKPDIIVEVQALTRAVILWRK